MRDLLLDIQSRLEQISPVVPKVASLEATVDNFQVVQCDLAAKVEDLCNRVAFLEHEAEHWRDHGSEGEDFSGNAGVGGVRLPVPPAVHEETLEADLARMMDASPVGPETLRFENAPASGPQERRAETHDLAQFDTPPASRGLSPDLRALGNRTTDLSYGAGSGQGLRPSVRPVSWTPAGVSHVAVGSGTPSCSQGPLEVDLMLTGMGPASPDAQETLRRSHQASLVSFHVPASMQPAGGRGNTTHGGRRPETDAYLQSRRLRLIGSVSDSGGTAWHNLGLGS